MLNDPLENGRATLHSMLSSVKPGEETLKRSLSNFFIDFSGSLLLQDRVAVHSKDVFDAADTKTFAEESKFCLRVLTQLNTFVHCSNDV